MPSDSFLDEEFVPTPCPGCGGGFPERASGGRIVCENGHAIVYNMRTSTIELERPAGGVATPPRLSLADYDRAPATLSPEIATYRWDLTRNDAGECRYRWVSA